MPPATNSNGPFWAFLASVAAFFLAIWVLGFTAEIGPVGLFVMILLFGLTYAFVYNEFFKK